jgi:hypothetical protein
MLKLTHISLATVEQLFEYKKQDFKLAPFPGYSEDQWGIKAHNRPWIEEVGDFQQNQKIIEVGGAYSTLPKYLADKYNLEAWVGDNFGEGSLEKDLWSRWGSPQELPEKNKGVKYIFENFGTFSKQYQDNSFDRIFSISTLEHIPYNYRLDVFQDMNRCLKSGGKQIHTIDIQTSPLINILKQGIIKKYPFSKLFLGKTSSEIDLWVDIMKNSGVKVNLRIPNPINLLNREILVESPDVVYRFYPPNNSPSKYLPTASLLVIIEKE